MKRLFDEHLYKFDRPQPSYWEATRGTAEFDAAPVAGHESCDVAIIGGGYTGLSAALHLARDYDIDVRVLEAGHIGWGASGRNGGFCSMGGTAVHAADLIKLCGEEKAREFYQSQIEAVELVRSLGHDENIDFQACGDAEVIVAHSEKAFAGLQKDCALLADVMGLETQLFSRDEARERFYDSTEQFGAMQESPTFGLHPLRYCRGLAAAAARRGARLHERSEVLQWQKSEDGMHRLRTAGGELRAKRVIFATNGFMPEALNPVFYGRTLPVISSIVVTRPLTDSELAAHAWVTRNPVINARKILNYFRLLPDNRFLFGARGSTAGTAAGEQETHETNIATMRRIWPKWANVDIDYRWHGLICMTGSLYPSVGRLDEDPSIFFGFGYHGNGVNTASWSGKQLADWLGTGTMPASLPAIVQGLSKRYPLPRLRPLYFKLALKISNWVDRRS
jgi:glycine/D-amino acid oxidase-like deaminating enzyme